MDHQQTIEHVLNRLADPRQTVCLDTETSGLDWRRNHIVGYVFTFGPGPDDTHYIPVRHAAGGNVFDNPGPQDPHGWDGWTIPLENELIRLLDQQGRLVFGHNLNFDLKFMMRVGCKLRSRYEDTIINAPLLDEFQLKMSLDYCAKVAGVEAKKTEVIRDHIRAKFPEATDKNYMGHYWRLSGSDPIAVEYAAGDGTTTWQLRDWQMERLAIKKGRPGFEQDLLKVHNIESRLIPILARMTVNGIKIDEERLAWVADHLQQRIDRLLGDFPAEFNARSSDDVRKYMESQNITNWPMTAHRKPVPSFTEGWLETHEPGKKIIAIRRLTTVRDSFVAPLRDTHLFNGRVHCNFNQLRGDEFGTITGRLSSNDPNLQATPKRIEEMGRLYRSIFIPTRGIWGANDYKQIEPRLLAYYSRCAVLLDDYRNNPDADAHTAVTKAFTPEYDDLPVKEQKLIRDRGKRVNQTIITGGGKGVLTTKYKVPPDVVDRLWRDYFKSMPEIKTLQTRASARMKTMGFVQSLLGRRAKPRSPDKCYVAVNRLLQCGNADCLKSKMVEIDDYLESEGRPLDMILNIHDDLNFDFDEAARPVYEECKAIMTRFGPEDLIPLDIPMGIDSGEGPNWALATYGPEKVK